MHKEKEKRSRNETLDTINEAWIRLSVHQSRAFRDLVSYSFVQLVPKFRIASKALLSPWTRQIYTCVDSLLCVRFSIATNHFFYLFVSFSVPSRRMSILFLMHPGKPTFLFFYFILSSFQLSILWWFFVHPRPDNPTSLYQLL